MGRENRKMPKTHVVFYQEGDGSCPVLTWLREIPPKAQMKCRIKMGRLAEMGHELRRPEADLLRDKISRAASEFEWCALPAALFFPWKHSGGSGQRDDKGRPCAAGGNRMGHGEEEEL